MCNWVFQWSWHTWVQFSTDLFSYTQCTWIEAALIKWWLKVGEIKLEIKTAGWLRKWRRLWMTNYEILCERKKVFLKILILSSLLSCFFQLIGKQSDTFRSSITKPKYRCNMICTNNSCDRFIVQVFDNFLTDKIQFKKWTFCLQK